MNLVANQDGPCAICSSELECSSDFALGRDWLKLLNAAFLACRRQQIATRGFDHLAKKLRPTRFLVRSLSQ
jgi:hypothetical protein